MLRRAVQQAASLRHLGTVELDGRPQNMVSFAWNNGLTPTLYIDAESHIVSKYELLFPDNLTGDAVSELSFPAYRPVDGIQVPTGYTQVIGLIKAEVPDKPIRYAVLGHHHDDHSGGIAAYVDEGTTIVTTETNRAYLERMAASSSTLAGEHARWIRHTRFEFVEGKKVFSDADHVVEVHDIGPNPHAEEMLICLSAEREADPPGRPAGDSPQRIGRPGQRPDRWVRRGDPELDLDVEVISSVHGTVGELADLELALAKREALDG